MTDYVARVKVQNGRIFHMMRERGMNQSELARAVGVSASDLGAIMNFKRAPLSVTGEWKGAVLKLADFFGCLPDEMFSKEQLALCLKSNSRDVFVTSEGLAQLVADGEPLALEDLVDDEKKRAALDEALKCLSPKEAAVISLRFGLHDGVARSLEQTGAMCGASANRMWQIECKALRKLRHPKRAKLFAPFSDEAKRICE